VKAACIAAVGQVLGRQPTEAEVRNIEDRLARSMRAEAVRDPQTWLAQPIDVQVRLGAERAARELADEAALKQQRAVQQVLAVAKVQQQIAAFPGSPFEALAHLVAFHGDRKGSTMSLETRARAIERDALRRMIDTLEATSPKFFGLIEDQEGLRDLVRELHGETTGNADARAGAKAFHEVTDALRNRFNLAGGDIGKLEDWGLPHHHSQLRVAKAGADRWIADVLPKLDRSKYLRENGARMTDAEVTAFLREAWTTIATGGVNKLEPGQFTGSGMRANRGNQTRQVHFASADAYLDYQRAYGEHTPYEVMLSHVAGIARDVALVEAFGPNPDTTYRLLRDQALKTMTLADPVRAEHFKVEADRVDNLYTLAAGKTTGVANPTVARFFDGLRNVLVAARLGSAALASIADEGTMRVAAHVNNLPEMRLISNELAAFNPANRVELRMALRAGLAMNTLAQSLNRFGNEGLGSGWSSKLAQATLRASGLNAMTDARRRAWGVTQMHALGAVVRDHATIDKLDHYDQRVLLSKGITPEEYEVWRRATLEDWGGGNDTMLTPDAIYRIPDAALRSLGDPRALREQAATRLLGMVLEETDVAVVEPGVRERAMMLQHVQRGTLKGELLRSFFLFKSFPIAMITRHWSRALAEPTMAGRAGYLAALLASTTVLGMVALQASQITQGKDPRDMTQWRSWVQAILKGGALSLYGDFLFNDATEHGGSVLATTAGPVAGLAEDAIALTIGNAHELADGKTTHAGAEAVKFARSNLPGANLWYARAAFDHLLFHQLQEYLSPGYLRKMRRRAERDYGQRFWWEPGAELPNRAPNMAAAVGDTSR
jgi:hypothetical protein